LTSVFLLRRFENVSRETFSVFYKPVKAVPTPDIKEFLLSMSKEKSGNFLFLPLKNVSRETFSVFLLSLLIFMNTNPGR